jgi:hypothetical protein
MPRYDNFDPSLHGSRADWRAEKAKAAGQQSRMTLTHGSSTAVLFSPAPTKHEPPQDCDEACAYLEALRPGGPWQLVAIEPRDGFDGRIEAATALTAEDIRRFIFKYNAEYRWGIYYAVNPLRTAMSKKAAKVDVASIEFVLSDLDPKSGETSEAAKARYLAALDGFTPSPTAVIDSGNGVQALWRLAEPIKLDEPILVDTVDKDKNRIKKRVFRSETAALIEDIENRIGALMVNMGGTAGTQNVDRILRLPGTINFPNDKKRKAGRVPCPALLIKSDPTATCRAEDFPYIKAKKKAADDQGKPAGDRHADGDDKTFAELPLELQKQIASPPYPGEDRSTTAMSVFSKLWRHGWSPAEIKAVVEQYPDGFVSHYNGGSDTLEKDIQRCFDKFEADADRDANEVDPGSKLPIIKVKAGRLSVLATKAEAVLITSNVPVYQRADVLVRPIIEAVDASRGRRTKVATLRGLDSVYMRDLLGRYAVWVKDEKQETDEGKKKAHVPVDPPTAVANTILARVGEWSFPSIAGVIATPTMRPDGSLLIAQGFDEATRLLLVEPPTMPAIPDQPTKADAEAALQLIEALLVEFPFVDEVSRAVALSGFITPIARGAFTVAPLHASRAPKAGSGKSFLWDVVAACAVGHLMPVISTGATTQELEKRLGTALMKSQPLIAIDNISGELGGDLLCQAIERPVVDVRVLGKSELVRCEARGTTLYATGNNFTIFGDVCRRVITCNLDAEMEQPELRQFTSDPVDIVLKDRGNYIAAALTICRAYIVAGRPNKADRLASFEAWSDTVRSALTWLGRADPVLSMESAKEEDPERLELISTMEAWNAAIGTSYGARLPLATVLMKGSATVKTYDGGDPEPEYPDLHNALQDVYFRATGRRGLPDARMLGHWLRRFRNRIEGNMRFCCEANPKGGSQWWLEQV